MSYEHCEKHDADATNGCEQCLAERQAACPHEFVVCEDTRCQKRMKHDEAVVWADEASPFTGPQVRALLDENERLRADKRDPVAVSLRAQFELKKFERRERATLACMQGLLAHCGHSSSPTQVAKWAVSFVDAMIEELGEPFP